MNEAIKDILKDNKHYDAYFIMDADNIMAPTFIEELEKTYYQGYDIGIGYRNCKNGNDNVISACSSLTFSMLNTLGNKKKNKENRNITISGTGFYISGSRIKEWGSFPFHSLTEDYEMTLYSILHDYTSFYNDKAIFYDEQPINYKQTAIQRIRWIRGYLEARKIYIKKLRNKLIKDRFNLGSIVSELVGVIPYIFMVIGALLFLIIQIISIVSNYFMLKIIPTILLYKCFGMLLLIYLVLMIFTITIIIKETNKIALSNLSKLKVIIINPLFFVTYLPCAVKALLKKQVIWEKIEHTKTIKY